MKEIANEISRNVTLAQRGSLMARILNTWYINNTEIILTRKNSPDLIHSFEILRALHDTKLSSISPPYVQRNNN